MRQIFFILLFIPFFLISQKQTLVYPKNKQILEDTIIQFQWDKLLTADYYRLQISRDSNFNNIIIDSNNIIGITLKYNFNWSTLPYYFRVKNYSSSDSSLWSKKVKFYSFSPAMLDSSKFWLRTDYGLRYDSLNRVSSWKSYLSKDSVTQIVDASKPIFVSNGNLSYLNHNSQWLIGKNMAHLNMRNYDMTTFLIYGSNRSSGIMFSMRRNGSNSQLFMDYFLTRSYWRLSKGDESTYSSSIIYYLNNTDLLMSTVINNDTLLPFLNGLSKGVYTNSFKNSKADEIGVGTRLASGVPYSGSFYECLVINSVLSDSMRQFVEKAILDRLTPPVNIGPNRFIDYNSCGNATISTSKIYKKYNWSTGDTTRSITIPNNVGWVWCDAPDFYGKIMRDSAYIDRRDLKDTTICLGDTVTVKPEFDNEYKFIWSTGDTTASIKVSQQGQYSVKIIDTLGCIIFDTVNIYVDSFPVSANFGNSDTLFCKGAKLELNNANDAQSFTWNDGSSNSFITIDSSGTYSVTATNSVGCVANDSINVLVNGIGPVVDFSYSSACFNDSTKFIDNSYSLDSANINKWIWDFGDGNQKLLYQDKEPTNLYPDTGFYAVTLTVMTDSGCSNYNTKNVYIKPLPVSNFSPVTGCENAEINFKNKTTDKSGLNTLGIWDFGDGTAKDQSLSNTEQPHIYSTKGNYNVKLLSVSSYGCKDSITKSVEIRPSPIADFKYSSVCDGSPVIFVDNSKTLVYNPLQTWSWTVYNGTPYPQQFTSQSPQYIFPSFGTYSTLLKVTALSGCSDTITLPVKVHAYPKAEFTYDTACFADSVNFADSSTIYDDNLISWNWNFYDYGVRTGSNAQILFNDTLKHNVSLNVKTDAGCSNTLIKIVKVHPKPIANFSTDKEFGLPPLNVNFTNLSKDFSSLNYLFGDGMESSVENPSHTYLDSMIYYPKLIVSNKFGCKDSIIKNIYTIYTAIDIEVTQIKAQLDGDFLKFSCQITNKGQFTVKELNLFASYNGGNAISQNWKGTLAKGETTNIVFVSGIRVLNHADLKYYCISAFIPQSLGQEDENISNNTMCNEYNNEFWVSNPYPNPVVDNINVDIILPYSQMLDISISDALGKVIKIYKQQCYKGLNQFYVNDINLSNGQYYLKVSSKENKIIKSFIIN